ncbi:MAG: hypothetical protein ACHQFX_13690 [Chitinophagales bacterium]
MSNKLSVILHEVISVQAGLLRFRHREKQQNLQVKVVFGGDNSLHCVITSETPLQMKIRGKKVHLIQKYSDNYFFISGYILREVQETNRIVSIGIIKASWFVRKRRGSVSWLREKYTYETNPEQLSLAS